MVYMLTPLPYIRNSYILHSETKEEMQKKASHRTHTFISMRTYLKINGEQSQRTHLLQELFSIISYLR